jgi:hypothetical protein
MEKSPPPDVYLVKVWRTTSGARVMETWYDADGKQHRIGGPAHIEQDPKTGVVTYEAYFVHGKSHREDGPAVTRRHAKTGRLTGQWWYLKNEQVPTPRSRRRASMTTGVSPSKSEPQP